MSRRNGIIASFASLFGCKASEQSAVEPLTGVSIYTEEFRLVLSGDWHELPSSDPNQILCESDVLKSSIVVSTIYANIPKDELVEAAEQLWLSREKSERLVRPNITFFDKYVGFKVTDQAGHVAYGGRDDESIFRFFGWTTERKILSFWIGTQTRDDAFAQRIAEDVMRQGFAMVFP